MKVASAPKRLARTFHDIKHRSSEGRTEDDRNWLEWAMLSTGGQLSWEELLQSRRILVVAEAGVGKTYECRAECDRLWEGGEAAIFFELAELARSDPEELLQPQQVERLERWRSSQSEVATFFLDSIDELKLSRGSFESAVRRLARTVASQMTRVKIVVTTRPVPFDLEIMQKWLPVPEREEFIGTAEEFADIMTGRRPRKAPESSPRDWRHVALNPLTDSQAIELVRLQGIHDADALLKAVQQRGAQEFTKRPQDLIELCADWIDHHQLRTHAHQVHSNVLVKLRARGEVRTDASLADDKSFEGASRLALASTLSRLYTLRHSAEADVGGTTPALNPVDVLPQWTQEDRLALLQRSLFGFASYGRVRFHHRSVVEYLSAYRLNRLSEAGMKRRSVMRLLFSVTRQGKEVVKPTMRPIAAWLALKQHQIFEEVVAREPEVMLQHGDPESLPPSTRVRVLQAFVTRYGRGGYRGIETPSIQVVRFSCPEVRAAASAIWREGVENPEVRELLLEIISSAPDSHGVEIAASVIDDCDATVGERLHAADILIAASDPRLVGYLDALTPSARSWNVRFVRALLPRAFPNHIAPATVARLLFELQPSNALVDLLGHHLVSSIESGYFPSGYLEELEQLFSVAAFEDIRWQAEWPHLRSQRADLIDLIAALNLRRIGNLQLSAAAIRSSVMTLRLADEQRDLERDPVPRLRRRLAEMPPRQRELIFWADVHYVDELRQESNPWTRFAESNAHGPFPLVSSLDESWLRTAVGNSAMPHGDRAVALEAAMLLRPKDIGLHEHAASLRPLVADDSLLLRALEDWLKPRPNHDELAQLEARQKELVESQKQRDATNHAAWVAFWKELAAHPAAAFEEDQAWSTVVHLWKAMRRVGDESRASGWNRRFIEASFGPTTVERLRGELAKIWRQQAPMTDSEDGTLTATQMRWQIGFAGITAESEDAGWAKRLTSSEAKIAAEHALLAIGGFPQWVESLADAHPEETKEVIGAALNGELTQTIGSNSSCTLLQCIEHAPPTVSGLFVPQIASWLRSNYDLLRDGEDLPSATRRLSQATRVIQHNLSSHYLQHLQEFAMKALAGGLDGRFVGVWLPVYMQYSPQEATTFLADQLKRSSEGERLAEQWLAHLFSDRSPHSSCNLSERQFTGQVLLSLVRLAYRYVRPSDDAEHMGTFTPSLRDDAEMARGKLMNALLAVPGTEGWEAKIEMANDPMFARFRDRAHALANEKAAEEADSGTMPPHLVQDIDQHYEAAPLTRQDIFALLKDRLTDLEDYLLEDYSPRETWAQIKEERVMRREISRFLAEQSRRTYTVNQEGVTADEKETDIRLTSVAPDQQAVIELKIGDERSGRDLFDTLRGQLLNKYLAPSNRRAGCLLVTISRDREWDHPVSGERLDKAGLIRLLNQECQDIEAELGGDVSIFASVLDLRPRLKTETKSRTLS